jgi:hypothetical protein
MVRGQIGTQPSIVGAHQMTGGRCFDVPLPIMTGVKQQPGAAHDANIPDPKEQRACRLAMPLDAKLLAALIVLPHDRIELFKPSALAIWLR